MGKSYFVYGASGYGREVMPLAKESVPNDKLKFIDDAEGINSFVNGYEVVNYKKFLSGSCDVEGIALAISNSVIRRKIFDLIFEDGFSAWTIIANNSILMDDIILGEGSIISPFVTITSNVKIGKCFQANLYSYIAHDCVVGDFVTMAPRVCCNGNVVIEDNVYIGTSAVIKQGTPEKPIVIGEGAVVGMGAVVTKSVPPGVTVVGNPAKALRKIQFGQ